MKYKCLHCNQVFELGEKDFRRCPNCFWTTSLVEEGRMGADEVKARLGSLPASTSTNALPIKERQSHPLGSWRRCANYCSGRFGNLLRACSRRRRLVKGAAILSGAALIFAVLFFIISNRAKISAALPKFMPIQALSLPRLPDSPKVKPTSPTAKPAQDPKTILTAEEWNELTQTFEITIPRPLTQDEEDILKKQSSFPGSLAKPPALLMWTKDDFDQFLESEQKKRKIPLGYWYQREIKKTFREHYLAAKQSSQTAVPPVGQSSQTAVPPVGQSSQTAATATFGSGDYLRVRDELIKSLAFPVYQNNLERYRAVVLVMLRPFINDVLGKIAVLNQYLTNQTLAAKAQALYQSYQQLAPVLDLHEWEKAANLIQALKREIASFEAQAGQAAVPASPALAAVDPEIQAAIHREATPPEGAAVSLKTLSVDLDLKEKIVNQNIPEALVKVQKQYERALELLKENKWDDAREELRAVQYPPELVQDAKKKIALINKMLAVQSAAH